MRTAQICPTCATYVNAVCVIYDGPYLAHLDVAPLTNLSEIIQQIDEVVSTLEPALGYIPENVANKIATAAEVTTYGSSVDKYPSVKAIKDYTDALVGQVTLQQVLNYNHSLTNGFNFQGTDAGLNNTGTSDVTGIGTNAAKNNSGEYVVAIGLNAGLSNTKNHLNAIGSGAGNQNDGLFVSAIGSAAAVQNLGDFVNAIGNGAGAGNEGDSVNAFGYAAADTNTGNHVNAIGKSAGVNNTFNDVTLLGNNASASADDQLVFSNGAGFNARLSNTNLTANHKFELPNADGTIVLSVNSTAPDSTGNVTLSTSTPTLQQVTTAGNITTDNIISQGTGATSIKASSTSGWGYAEIAQNSTIGSGFLGLNNGVTGTVTLGAFYISGTKDLQLPNQSGVLVATVNNIAPDNAGNVTLAVGTSYKVYSAIVSYNSLNLTVVSLLENTLGVTLTWSADFIGPKATASSTIFTANKTVITATPYTGPSSQTFNNVGTRVSTTVVNLFSVDTTNGSFSYADGVQFFLEIRVYS